MPKKNSTDAYLDDCLKESIFAKQRFVKQNRKTLVDAAVLLAYTVNQGGKILICGNGGSAADSQHMAAEMVGRLLIERRPLPVIALTTDSSNLTAIGNDYGYDHVFQRQVQGLGQPKDVLVAISTSGNSPNVLLAAEAADAQGMALITLTGGTGGKLLKNFPLATHLNVSSGKNSCRIQESHIFAIHMMVDLMDRYFLQP